MNTDIFMNISRKHSTPSSKNGMVLVKPITREEELWNYLLLSKLLS
jgi:hypothetical protein